MSKAYRGCLLPLLAVSLIGCGEQPDPDDYFPLNPGLRWQYQVTEELTDEKRVYAYEVENRRYEPLAELGEFYAQTPVAIRHTSEGTDYYVMQEEGATFRIAKRTVIEYRPREDLEPRMILPAADEFESGISWSYPTQPYALRSVQSAVDWNRSANAFEMTFQVVETGVTLKVLAGEFKNCIHIEGEGLTELYADPRTGFQQVEVVQHEWYAPGVGLIKFERQEPLDFEMFKGGTITFELIAFDD